MRNIIILLLLSASLNAQQVYRVYLKTGTVEFKQQAQANQFAIANHADSIVLVIKPVLQNVDSIEQAKTLASKTLIIQAAQSAVGIDVRSLSITQVRALYAFDLLKMGALDSALKVKPLKDWIK